MQSTRNRLYMAFVRLRLTLARQRSGSLFEALDGRELSLLAYLFSNHLATSSYRPCTPVSSFWS